MRITVKCIIKWGLIAEIITAIVGQVGEFTLRYKAYSNAFDEIFGRYRLPINAENEEFELNPNSMEVTGNSSAKLQSPIGIDPNHLHYDHRSGRTLHLSPPANASQAIPNTAEPLTQQSSVNTTEKSTLATIMDTIFRTSISSKDRPNKVDSSPLFSFDSYSSPVSDMLTMPKSVDPRPLLVCAVLVCLNLLYIVGIVLEYLPLVCPLTIVWLLYLILVLLILHAGSTTAPSSSATIVSQSPWATLTPSPFTILVESIILVFSLILIAIIVEERRQFAMRIRAKSAAIPLVKSRDMDLDEI